MDGAACNHYMIGDAVIFVDPQGRSVNKQQPYVQPPTLPIDSTLPLPFVSLFTRSVSIRKAEGSI